MSVSERERVIRKRVYGEFSCVLGGNRSDSRVTGDVRLDNVSFPTIDQGILECHPGLLHGMVSIQIPLPMRASNVESCAVSSGCRHVQSICPHH
jgi:hypothetical protein